MSGRYVQREREVAAALRAVGGCLDGVIARGQALGYLRFALMQYSAVYARARIIPKRDCPAIALDLR